MNFPSPRGPLSVNVGRDWQQEQETHFQHVRVLSVLPHVVPGAHQSAAPSNRTSSSMSDRRNKLNQVLLLVNIIPVSPWTLPAPPEPCHRVACHSRVSSLAQPVRRVFTARWDSCGWPWMFPRCHGMAWRLGCIPRAFSVAGHLVDMAAAALTSFQCLQMWSFVLSELTEMIHIAHCNC